MDTQVIEPVKSAPEIDTAQRQKMIEEAAYFRAEKRGFKDGDPALDWLEAEVEVDRLLGCEDKPELTVKPVTG